MTFAVDIYRIFYGATSYNQPMNDWCTYQIENYKEALAGATSFDQAVKWDISSATDLSGMLDSTAMSTANYDETLEELVYNHYYEELIPKGLTLGAAGLSYSCDGETERNTLTTTYNWTIEGDIPNCSNVRIAQDHILPIAFEFYPNPVTNALFITGGDINAVQIVSLNGSIVLQENKLETSALEIDVKSLIEGL